MDKLKPSKIVAVGLNYVDHARELKEDIPRTPLLFLKPPSSVIASNDKIIYPEMTKELHYEAELAIIIKEKIRNLRSAEQALHYIQGYTCANDVTARDLQRGDGQWTRSKSFDTFCPLGPEVVWDIDPNQLRIRTYLNGKLKQDSNTSNMIFKPNDLVVFVSQVMTLYPGDVILTGTPPGVGPMQKGDVVEVEIEGIGKLKNFVV